MHEEQPKPAEQGKEAARKPNRQSPAQRQRDAKVWLERLLRPPLVTDERITELAPYAYRYKPGSRFQEIADAMVRNHELPTYEKVAARYQARKEAWLKRNHPSVPVTLTDPDIQQITGMIDASWTERGRGPSWAQIRTAMNWDRAETNEALTRLRDDGIVTFTPERGSLRLPKAQR